MPMGVSIPVRALNMVRACAYIHGVGFCIAYSTIKVFLVPQKADKQEKRSAFFVFNKSLSPLICMTKAIFDILIKTKAMEPYRTANK